jgi:hypothetical protein
VDNEAEYVHEEVLKKNLSTSDWRQMADGRWQMADGRWQMRF